MKHLVGRTGLAAAALLVAVACGGNTPASSSAPTVRPSASSPAGASPPATALPTASAAAPTATAPASTPASTPASQPTPGSIFGSHGDPALEALLPPTIAGKPLTIYSLTLTQLLDQGGDRASVDAFLLGIGKTEADGSWAAAFDPTNPVGGGINAFKVAGADAAALLAGITALQRADLGDDATIEQAIVEGRNVTVLSIGDGVNDTLWVYGYGDVVFVVHAADTKGAATFLAALP